jgi:hypothetical protein
MKPIQGILSFIFFLGTTAVPAVAAADSVRTYVQATILASNPAKGTLTFLDASGRQRVERATGDALPALSLVRPGDQAILSLVIEAGGPVITKIRRSRPAEPPAQVADANPSAAGAAPAAVTVGSAPLRRRWPNPYTKSPRPEPDRP